MKKFLFLCFSVLFTNLIWSQQQDLTVSGLSSVEVGVNNPFTFTFSPTTQIPIVPTGSNPVVKYKLTSWFISSSSSNMNNSGQPYFNDNSQSLTYYSLGQSQSLNFPIKWTDNSNSLTDDINIAIYVQYFDTNNNPIEGSKYYSKIQTINVNRIFTPTISSTPILSCCNAPVTFSASNYGTANVFNWLITGGTYTGSGSSITVTPSAGSGSVFASCVVSRSTGLSSYTRSNSVTVSRTLRTATFTGLFPEYPNNTQPFNYICKGGGGRQMSMATQCGLSTITWVAPNCTIVGQNTLTPTITPTSAITTGSSINIYAVVGFTGGCTATTPNVSFQILDGATAPVPAGYFQATPNNGDICTADVFQMSFVSTNGFNNGITTISPDFIGGPGDPIHYKPTKATAITVCNKNLCTGLTTCKVFNVFPPAPCAPAAKIASTTTTAKLIIAPNPTNGNLKITLPETLSGTYQVFDQTTSQIIQENKFDNQSELQIDLSQKLRNGIYVLKVITENNTFTEKIILNK